MMECRSCRNTLLHVLNYVCYKPEVLSKAYDRFLRSRDISLDKKRDFCLKKWLLVSWCTKWSQIKIWWLFLWKSIIGPMRSTLLSFHIFLPISVNFPNLTGTISIFIDFNKIFIKIPGTCIGMDCIPINSSSYFLPKTIIMIIPPFTFQNAISDMTALKNVFLFESGSILFLLPLCFLETFSCFIS